MQKQLAEPFELLQISTLHICKYVLWRKKKPGVRNGYYFQSGNKPFVCQCWSAITLWIWLYTIFLHPFQQLKTTTTKKKHTKHDRKWPRVFNFCKIIKNASTPFNNFTICKRSQSLRQRRQALPIQTSAETKEPSKPDGLVVGLIVIVSESGPASGQRNTRGLCAKEEPIPSLGWFLAPWHVLVLINHLAQLQSSQSFAATGDRLPASTVSL